MTKKVSYNYNRAVGAAYLAVLIAIGLGIFIGYLLWAPR